MKNSDMQAPISLQDELARLGPQKSQDICAAHDAHDVNAEQPDRLLQLVAPLAVAEPDEGQLAHVDASAWPVAAEAVPAGQRIGDDAPAGQ